MKKIDRIKEQLQEENPDALLADGFDAALIGIGRRISQPSLAIYSRKKCIEILSKEMSYEDAEEYFEFNVSGAWMGPNTPIFISN